MDDDKLNALYPFLGGGKADVGAQQQALAESVRSKAADSLRVKQAFFERNSDALIAAAHAVADSYRQQGRLFAMGNGGSSCDATHLCVEFQHPVTAGRPALPAFNLGMDTAMLTAVGNDVGIEHIFVRQLEAHGRPGDVLVAFSTSGHSANLIAGLRKGHELGMKTLGFVGGDGGEMRRGGLLHHCLWVDTDSIHRVQETHVACYHILWDLVHTLLADERGKLGAAVSSARADPHPRPAPPPSLRSPQKERGEKAPSASETGVGVRAHRARELRQAPTDAEQRLWYHLRARRLGGFKFRRQHPIGRYFADFACLEPKLVVELDGGQHAEQAADDARRTRFIEQQGFVVLRFWNNEALAETESVLEGILTRAQELAGEEK